MLNFVRCFSRRIVLIIVLMVLSGTLSLIGLFDESLRLDEAQSLWQASRSPKRLIELVAQDVHTPFYFLLLRTWQQWFGNDVTTARLLSLLFSLLTIPLIYVLGKAAFRPSVGLYAAILAAFSPLFSWYSSEIRMYSLFVFLVVANQYAFVQLCKRNTTASWVKYILSVIPGLFIHYFFLLHLLVQGLFLFLRRRVLQRKIIQKFLITVLISGLLFAPWMKLVIDLGLAAYTRPLLERPTSIDFFLSYAHMFFGFQEDHINAALLSLWPLSLIISFLFLRRNLHVPFFAVFFLFSAVASPFLSYATSVTLQPVLVPRYLIFAAPALYLFLAWMLSVLPPAFARPSKVLLVVGMLLASYHQMTSATTPLKESYREASVYVSAYAAPQDIVLVSVPFTIYPFDYYYCGVAAVTTIPQWDRFHYGPIPRFSRERLEAEIEPLRRGHRHAWLLLSYDQGYEQEIRDYFDTHFERLDLQEFSSGLTLGLYKLRYDEASSRQGEYTGMLRSLSACVPGMARLRSETASVS